MGNPFFSTEGITQGGPVGMPMCDLSVLPLIWRLFLLHKYGMLMMCVPVALLKLSFIGGITYCQKVQTINTKADSTCFQGTGVNVVMDVDTWDSLLINIKVL